MSPSIQAEFRVFVQHWREALVEVFSAALTRVEERSPKTKMDS
jgi:DNA-binding SARP family transcriptional activator